MRCFTGIRHPLFVEITGKGEAFITDSFNNRIACFLNASPLRPNSIGLVLYQVVHFNLTYAAPSPQAGPEVELIPCFVSSGRAQEVTKVSKDVGSNKRAAFLGCPSLAPPEGYFVSRG